MKTWVGKHGWSHKSVGKIRVFIQAQMYLRPEISEAPIGNALVHCHLGLAKWQVAQKRSVGIVLRMHPRKHCLQNILNTSGFLNISDRAIQLMLNHVYNITTQVRFSVRIWILHLCHKYTQIFYHIWVTVLRNDSFWSIANIFISRWWPNGTLKTPIVSFLTSKCLGGSTGRRRPCFIKSGACGAYSAARLIYILCHK